MNEYPTIRSLFEDPEMCRMLLWMGLFLLTFIVMAFYPRRRK